MAHEDPKGPQADISILYVLNQNIQFRSGPVLGSNSDLPSGLGPLVGTYPWRVDSGVPGSHLHCRPVTQYVWLRTLNPPRGVWPCAEGVGTCSGPLRTCEIGVFGDPQNGPPGGHNGTPKLTPFGGHIQSLLPGPDPDVHVEGQRATTVTYVVRFRT